MDNVKMKARNVTRCTTCGVDVGVSRNWNNYQAGRLLPGWKIARHAAGDHRGGHRKGDKRPICGGSGVLVDEKEVRVRDLAAV